MLRGTLWPALITLGVVIPVIPNSVPVTLITETVKSVAPVFKSERLLVPAEPTLTVPKFTVCSLSEICGCIATAVAERLNTTGALVESP